jgi:hypothetical protein
MHHFRKANLYRVPSLFQNSYKVPLHFRNVYYYKSLLNLNMRLMVLRPHGAGAVTVVHRPQQQQQQQGAMLDSNGLVVNGFNSAAANQNNSVSISCPDLQLKQVLVVKKNDNLSQAGTSSQQPGSTINGGGLITKNSINANASNASAFVTGNLNNNMSVVSAPRVLYPVLTIRELKQLKQQANQYTANMNRLKTKGSGSGLVAGQPVPNTNLSELKTFSGAQVLNVGSILLRPSGAVVGPGGETVLRSRRNSTRPAAQQQPPLILPSSSHHQPDRVKLPSDGVDKSAATAAAGSGISRANKTAVKSDETKRLITKKKKKAASSSKADVSKPSGGGKSASSEQVKLTEEEEDEDDDEEEGEDEEGEDEEGEDEEDEDEEEEDEDEDDDDEEEDCDNCFTRNKFGNILYKYVYKPVARPVKFIYYSVLENIKLFRLFKFCLFALCNFILSFFYEAPFYFINSYMVETGSSANQAGTITVAVGIVSVFSSSKLWEKKKEKSVELSDEFSHVLTRAILV